ncbi:MAG: hypothetical protein AAF266_07270 [Planctomycetota bacterium]
MSALLAGASVSSAALVESFEGGSLGGPVAGTNIGGVFVDAGSSINTVGNVTEGSFAAEIDLTGQTSTFGKGFETFLFKGANEAITSISMDVSFDAPATSQSGYLGLRLAGFTSPDGFFQHPDSGGTNILNNGVPDDEYLDVNADVSFTITYQNPDHMAKLNAGLEFAPDAFAKFEIFINKAANVEGVLTFDNIRTTVANVAAIPEAGSALCFGLLASTGLVFGTRRGDREDEHTAA